MKYAIITGSSKGLGEALVREMKENYFVFFISRSENKDLNEFMEDSRWGSDWLQTDLSSIENAEKVVDIIFSRVDKEECESIILINNAGVLDPIKPLGKCKSKDIKNNIDLNLIAPMVLSSGFISNLLEVDCKKTIITISSGAAKKPYFGWSSYCSGKAGIDMMTKCIDVEEKEKKNPVKAVSIAPGVMNTKMQEKIRNANKEDFEQLERFIKLKEEGRLFETSTVANKLIDMYENDEFESGDILDIRDYINQ